MSNCKYCRYFSVEKGSFYGVCTNEHVGSLTHFSNCNNLFHEDFGCVEFALPLKIDCHLCVHKDTPEFKAPCRTCVVIIDLEYNFERREE